MIKTWWNPEVEPRAIKLFRLLFGLVLIFEVFSFLSQVPHYMTIDSFLPYSTLTDELGPKFTLLNHFQENPTLIKIYIAVFIALLLWFSFVKYNRLICVLCFLFWIMLTNRAAPILNGGHSVATYLLFFSIFFPNEKRHSTWAIRAIQLQLAVVYFSTGLYKIQSPEWKNLSAIYFATRSQDLAKYHIPFVLDNMYFIHFLTFLTLVFEIGFPLFFIFEKKPQVRVVFAIFGILFHIGIFITLRVPFFCQVMLSSYCLLFFPTKLFRVCKVL